MIHWHYYLLQQQRGLYARAAQESRTNFRCNLPGTLLTIHAFRLLQEWSGFDIGKLMMPWAELHHGCCQRDWTPLTRRITYPKPESFCVPSDSLGSTVRTIVLLAASGMETVPSAICSRRRGRALSVASRALTYTAGRRRHVKVDLNHRGRTIDSHPGKVKYIDSKMKFPGITAYCWPIIISYCA